MCMCIAHAIGVKWQLGCVVGLPLNGLREEDRHRHFGARGGTCTESTASKQRPRRARTLHVQDSQEAAPEESTLSAKLDRPR